MCTVSVISEDLPASGEPAAADVGRRVRIACNRDEARTRPSALAPQIRLFGTRQAIMPIDPVSDGTWIAVNDAGVAASLLNVYDAPAASSRASARFRSRGVIVPRLMTCGSAQEAAGIAHKFDAQSFPTFRIVIADEDVVFELRSDGARLHSQQFAGTGGPWMFTSSGLGDDVVEAPRRELFEEMLVHSVARGTSIGNSTDRQDAFHRFRWQERPEISVCMARSDARTVSYTVVEINPRDVALSYYPEAPDHNPPPIVIRMARRRSS